MHIFLLVSVLSSATVIQSKILTGFCVGDGTYFADGKEVRDAEKNKGDFNGTVPDKTQIIGIKCCSTESAISRNFRGIWAEIGSHVMDSSWKCLQLPAGEKEPEGWTEIGFKDRSWPNAEKVQPKGNNLDNVSTTAAANKWIWLSESVCSATKSCTSTCLLCRYNIDQSSKMKEITHYPRNGASPVEDVVYVASNSLIVDVMSCDVASIVLKPCNMSGNVFTVTFSAVDQVGSSIQQCQKIPTDSSNCMAVATGSDVTISCLHFTSFYISFPPEGSLSVRHVGGGPSLMSFDGWKTPTCDRITSAVIVQNYPKSRYRFQRSLEENYCLVMKDEVFRLHQCGDDYIDEEQCLSCGCCWQAVITDLFPLAKNTRCFLSFANSTKSSGACHISLKDAVGKVIFQASNRKAFNNDAIGFYIGVQKMFPGIKFSVDFGDGKSNLSVNASKEQEAPAWVKGNQTGHNYKAVVTRGYAVPGKKMATLRIVDTRKRPNKMLSFSINITIAPAGFVIVGNKNRVDLFEEVTFVLLKLEADENTETFVDFGDNLTARSELLKNFNVLPRWIPSFCEDYAQMATVSHFYYSSGEKTVIARYDAGGSQNNHKTNLTDLSANTTVKVLSLNETFAKAQFKVLTEQPIAKIEPVEFAFTVPRFVKNTMLEIEFDDKAPAISFMMDNSETIPEGVTRTTHKSGYTFKCQHTYISPGKKQPVARISVRDQPNEMFEIRTSTTVLSELDILGTLSLFTNVNKTNLYEEVSFVFSSTTLLKCPSVLIDLGDASQIIQLNLTKAFKVPAWYRKAYSTPELKTYSWVNIWHPYSVSGLKTVVANLTDGLKKEKLLSVQVTKTILVRSVEETLQELVDSFKIPENGTGYVSVPIDFSILLMSRKVLVNTRISIDFGDNSNPEVFMFTKHSDIPKFLNFSHTFFDPGLHQLNISATSHDHKVSISKTVNFTALLRPCKPEESVIKLGDVVITLLSEGPPVEGNNVTFRVSTNTLLDDVQMMDNGCKDRFIWSLNLTKTLRIPSAKKYDSYRAIVQRPFCDPGKFWIQFTLFTCLPHSVENITRHIFVKVFSLKEYVGNPIISYTSFLNASGDMMSTIFVALENAVKDVHMTLDFGDCHMTNVTVGDFQEPETDWQNKHKIPGKFVAALNHSYSDFRLYTVTFKVYSKGSECVVKPIVASTVINIKPVSEVVDLLVESQAYQSFPVDEMITFDVYTEDDDSDFSTELSFGLGNETVIEYEPLEITKVHSYSKHSYRHKFLNPGLYHVSASTSEKQQNSSLARRARRSRCVNIIAFDEAVGKVKIITADEKNKIFSVGEAVYFVVLVENFIHGMNVSMSYGDDYSKIDKVQFSTDHESLPSWAIQYKEQQYHFGITSHVFEAVGMFKVAVRVTKEDAENNVTRAVSESIWITINLKLEALIVMTGGGKDMINAVKYTRQQEIHLSASAPDFHDDNTVIRWIAERVGVNGNEIIYIPSEVQSNKTDLLVPPYSLNFGSYLFQIQFSMVNSRGYMDVIRSNATWITIIALPLQIVITTKPTSHGVIPAMKLDGSGSRDPNEADNGIKWLTFDWHCSKNENFDSGEIHCNTISSCIRSCKNTAAGNYQSCKGCNVYASCFNDTLYDSNPCPAESFWDDVKKRCSTKSITCPCMDLYPAVEQSCFRGRMVHLMGPVIEITVNQFKFSRSQVDYYFKAVARSRLRVIGQSAGVKVSVISQHFLGDSRDPSLDIVCKTNCKDKVEPDYPVTLTYMCLLCQFTVDDVLSPNWKLRKNSMNTTQPNFSWKRHVISYRDLLIIKPGLFNASLSSSQANYTVTLKVTGPRLTMSASYTFAVEQRKLP